MPAFKVAVTGGIGSGKTAVSDRFRQLGIDVIDADLIAREAVDPDQPALRQIVDTFGEHVLNGQGSLDRAALRSIVFGDAHKKKQLENILHPIIARRIHEAAAQAKSPYTIIVIPLLAESERDYGIDRVLVVDAPPEVQIARVAKRDKQTPDQVRRIINMQTARQNRLGMADDICINTGSIEELNKWVDSKHRHYLSLAARHALSAT